MIREVVLRNPVVIRRGTPMCRDCGMDPDHPWHEPLRECQGGTDDPSTPCPDPARHHAYRATPRLRRIRRRRPWEMFEG